MALATYADLKTSVQEWLNRPDLTGYVADFIRLGEQRIFYGSEGAFPSQPLRVPAMMEQETGTITSSSIAFPSRFVEPIRLAASSGGQTWSLTYTPPERYSEAASSSGVPTSYTYLDNAIKTAGTGAASYTLDYYKAFDALTSDTDTNWALTNTPGVYLYAALIESAPFLHDESRVNTWHAMFSSLIAAANRATHRHGGGALVTRVVT